MSQTAAHLVDHVIPHVPVRQWGLSLPIPLRLLLAAQPELVMTVLQVEQRVVTRHLLDRAGLKRRGVLAEEMGQTCLAEPDADGDKVRTLRPLQAAAVTYRIAFGPRAGQNVPTLRRARRGKLSQPEPRPEPRRPSQTPRPRAATQDRSRGGDARRFGATPSESGSTLRT
jgi:hypothetical protein